jgi:hypothetical protein
MSAELERWEELACDAALTGLDAADRAELAALSDADVERELVALERVAGEVAAVTLAAADLAPAMSPALEARVRGALEALEAPAEKPPADKLEDAAGRRARREAAPSARAERAPAWGPTWGPWAFAAAAAVLAILGWSRPSPDGTRASTPPRADHDERRAQVAPSSGAPATAPSAAAATAGGAGPRALDRAGLLAVSGTTELPWSPTKDPAARGATGEVVWHGGLQHGFMSFRGLAANDPTKFQYQLWIFDSERDEAFPVDGGVFDVSAAGEAVVPIEAKLHVGKAKLFAVTVEKPGGVVVSKRERIVVTAAPRG